MCESRGFVLRWMRAHPLLCLLSLERQEQLASLARRRAYEAEEVIFLQEEPAEGMWVIERGSVKIYRLSPDGDEQTLRLLGPGDSFDEIAALDGGANPASAAALSPVAVWLLPTSYLTALASQDLAFANGIVQFLAGRVRALVQQVEDLTVYPMDARLARFLLRQAENPSLQGHGITRKAIAGHLAATPETVSRTLRTLQLEGAIRFDRHRIVITDEDRLRDIARLQEPTPITQVDWKGQSDLT